MQAMEGLLPKLGREKPSRKSRRLPARSAAGLVCCWAVCSGIFPSSHAATVRVLAARACEVVAPQAQPCCGALLMHAGEEAAAMELAKRTIDAFEPADIDTIVTNAPVRLKREEYGHCSEMIPEYAGRARFFAANAKTSAKYWPASSRALRGKRLTLRVAYHDSCHLQHAQGVRSQPRVLLSSIQGWSLSKFPKPLSAAAPREIFNLVQPDAANELGTARQGSSLR